MLFFSGLSYFRDFQVEWSRGVIRIISKKDWNYRQCLESFCHEWRSTKVVDELEIPGVVHRIGGWKPKNA